MKIIRLKLEAAGLGRFTPVQAVVSILAFSTLFASWVQLSFGVVGLSLFAFLVTIGAAIETLSYRARQRTDQLSKVWPEIIDSLQSAAGSGYGIVDSFEELALSGPASVRTVFQGLVERIDSGVGIEKSLDWLKSQFGSLQADRLVELIRIVHRAGGTAYLESLRDQSLRTREEIALWGELQSKQGWVSGTAKLAIVSPWIVVGTLSARPENVAIYNTTEGLTILLSGLVVSLIAYRLVNLLGNLTRPKRVLIR